MVDDTRKQNRIKSAVADFFKHGLKEVQAKRVTRPAPPAASLFDGTENRP
jgi:hypothetical protein